MAEQDPQHLDQDPEQDGWLTLAQTAQRLDVSIYTVRRQLKRGELEGKQVNTRHGLTWLVRLSALPGDMPTVGSEPKQPAQGVDTLELLRMLERQQQTIMELSGRIGYLQAELTQAKEQLALQAPKVDEAPVDGNVPPAEPQPTEQDAKPRPWWRFW